MPGKVGGDDMATTGLGGPVVHLAFLRLRRLLRLEGNYQR
jgi:hypothetical protein